MSLLWESHMFYSGKESTGHYRRHMRHGFDPWVRKILWSKKYNPLQYSWVIYNTYWSIQSPMYRGVWQATVHGDAELDTTKQLNTHRHTMPLFILTLRYLNNTVSCSHCSILRFRSMGFPVGSVDKDLPTHAGDARDVGSIPESGRPPGGGNNCPLQYY